MKKTWMLLMALLSFTYLCHAASTGVDNPLNCKWVVYYGNAAQPADFNPFNPIVLDADSHPALSSLMAEDKTLLGYVSLGEVGNYRYYFQDVQNAGILISQNPNYPGSWYVDIRNSYWTNLMINTVIPNVLASGFQGIFMDSLDIPIYLEAINPSAYSGMTQAAIDLVIAIRTAFPDTPLMLNRAYQILSNVGGYIDYALGESVFTTYNFGTQQYQYVDQAGYQWSLGYLQGAQSLYPNLVVMSLDYWDPADTATYRKIYKTERSNGFRPYVSTISLQTITPEP